ncbi:MAG: DUF4139 domain-containing protein, partial [Mailhella sp.]|nr:DUF4139 domain-containing protein [Mailhella sp.]
MRILKTMLSAAFMAAFAVQAVPAALAADGRHITLYGEGAQVLEEMTGKAVDGEAVFLLPASVDASSLRVTAKSASVFSVRTRTVAASPAEGSLQARLKELQAKEAALTREKELLELRRGMMAGAAVSFVQADEVGRLDDILAKRGADFAEAMRRVEEGLAETARAIELVKRDIKAGGMSDERLEGRAGFADASGRPVSGGVDAVIAYDLGGCGWSPRLDVRADTAAGTVTVTRMAGIEQKSGMDWDGAHLVLAEGPPDRQITPRGLSPWRPEP